LFEHTVSSFFCPNNEPDDEEILVRSSLQAIQICGLAWRWWLITMFTGTNHLDPIMRHTNSVCTSNPVLLP